MKKNYFLLTSALVAGTLSYETAARTVSEAYTIAKKALTTSQQVDLYNTATNENDTLFYTFKGKAGGFAIVSAKDQTPALLAYNKYQHLNGELPESLVKMLGDYYGNPANMKQTKTNGTQTSGLKVSRLTGYTIEPLLGETAWGQDAPYNNDCPSINGTTAPTGCVATAVAQVMHYYKHPSAVLSDIPAYTTTTNSIARTGVSKGTTIDWDKMNDVYGDDFTTESGEAVAKLMSMVGTAFNMDYKETESSCAKAGIKELASYFGYDQELAHKAFRKSYTLQEWYNLIYTELKAKRPVLFSGSTMKSGHRFICDGIDADGMFHINWGWRGDYNGYYDLTLLNPQAGSEIGASTSKDGYTKDDYVILGLTPDNGKTDDKPTTDIVSISVKDQTSGGSHYLFYTSTNPYANAVSVYTSSGYVDENGNVVKIGVTDQRDYETDILYSDETASSIDVSGFKEGKYYKVGLIESEDGVNWRVCEGYNNVNVVYTVKNGEVIVASQAELEVSFEATDFSRVGYDAYGRIDLKNTGNQEYNDVIYLMTSSTTTNPMKYSHAAVITVEPGDSNSLDVSFVPQSDTVYYWVMDKNLDELKSGFVVRKSAAYKLEATATFDTLANGKIYCNVNVKNVGDTYYKADLVLTLFHSAGNSVVSTEAYIKAGDSAAVQFEVSTEYKYTQYTISDYKGNIILSNQLKDNSDTETIPLRYNLAFSVFHAKGDSITGVFLLTNSTEEVQSDDYIIMVGPSLSSCTDIAFWEEVSIPADSYEERTFATVAPGDTICYQIIKGTQLIAQGMTFATKSAVDKVLASSALQSWTENGAIVASAAEDCQLSVYNTAGICIVSKQMQAGEVYRLPVAKGVYIVNGKKVLVK